MDPHPTPQGAYGANPQVRALEAHLGYQLSHPGPLYPRGVLCASARAQRARPRDTPAREGWTRPPMPPQELRRTTGSALGQGSTRLKASDMHPVARSMSEMVPEAPLVPAKWIEVLLPRQPSARIPDGAAETLSWGANSWHPPSVVRTTAYGGHQTACARGRHSGRVAAMTTFTIEIRLTREDTAEDDDGNRRTVEQIMEMETIETIDGAENKYAAEARYWELRNRLFE